MPTPVAVAAYFALLVATIGLLLARSVWSGPNPPEADSRQMRDGGTRRRATLRRATAFLLTWSLTAELVLVALVSSAVPALADSSDLLLTTTPPPPGFTKTWECFLHYEGTNTSPFDGNDETFCTVDNGDPHNVTADFHWAPGPSERFTIRSFRIKVDHTNSRAFLTSLHVKCGMNESGQVGRPTVWQAPSSMMNVPALDTLYIDLDTPCEIISNTGHGYAGISIGWTSSFADEPFCCTGLRIYSFEAYAESRAGKPWALGAFCLLGYGKCSPDPVNLATGNFTHQAEDLPLPGRVLGLTFTRWYNSADTTTGPFGPAWTHSFNWKLTDGGTSVEVRRGDGRRETFSRNPDGTYATPPDTFDTLVKNGDATYTLALTDQLRYEFSTSGQLSGIHEPAGNLISLSYTGANLTTITDSVGRLVTLSYDGSNRLTQLVDPLGRKLSYAYDASGRLATVTDKIGNAAGQDPLLHQWRYGYEGTSERLTTITDPDGRVQVTNTYDGQGRVFEQRDGLNALTTIAYSPGQTVLTDPRNHATTYSFDSRARVLTQSDVVGGTTFTTNYTYDAQGNRTSVTDRNGNRTDFAYDSRGNLLSRTDPQINPQTPRYLTQFQYDGKNNLTQLTDARNFVTSYSYDPVTNVRLSMSQQIDAVPTFAVTRWEYTDSANPGLPTRIISPRGNTGPNPNYTYSQSLSYDSQANLAQKIDADGNKTTYGNDGAGRQTSMVDPDGNAPGGVPAEHTWTTTYDGNDRVTKLTDPLGHFAQVDYDGAGNRSSETDRSGNVSTFSYDGAGRLQTVQQKPDPIGQPTLIHTTSVVRDGNGNPTRVTQGNGVLTDYGYDALNRLTSVTTHPSSTQALTTTYVLDGNGNATARTSADNVTVTYGYDALSRLTSVSATGLSTITYGYDELSRRTSMVDGTGTSTYQYDGLGRIVQAAQPNGTLTYGYDLDSNRTTLGYPTVGNVTYAVSPAGRLSTLTDWASRTSSYTYSAAGLAKTVSLPNGMTTTYTYDRALRLTSVVNATASQTISSHGYTLDNEGNRIALDEQLSGIFPSAKVNSDTGTAVQDHPAVAIGADGASYLLWDDARNGNADIFFSKRDPFMDAWGANVKVNTDTGTRLQLNPALALDAQNNAYAVWQDERNSLGQPDIFYRKRTAATEAWGSNIRVDDAPSSTTQRNPRIAGTAAGAETAVWVDLRQSQKNIYSAQLAAGGSSWSTPNKRVTDNTSAVKDFPDVTVGSDGTAYAVWQDSRNGNTDIFFSSLAAGGSAWAANVKISDDPGSAAQRLAKVGIDAAGNLTVLWIDDRTTPSRVRAVRKPAGGSWSASVVVSDAPAKPQSLALSVRSDGYAWATWGDTRASSQDIWGSRYDPHTNNWSAPLRLDDDPGTTAAQSNPTVAFTSSETMLAWRDNRLSANGDTRARRAVFVPGLTEHFSYGYDGLNRLKTVTGPASESFVLDGASNITSRTGPPATNTYDQANRQTADGSQSYVWSDADRLTQRGSDGFTYNPLDRLTSSSVDGSSLNYFYDGDGLLVRTRFVDPCPSPCAGPLAPIFPTTTYLWDPSARPAPLLRVTNVGWTDDIVYGLGPLYVVRADASTLTFARDGLGSVRAQVDGSGAVTNSVRYAAYGDLSAAPQGIPSVLGYAGELRSSEGLIYLRARWYDSSTGRFLTRDPVVGKAEAPASLNGFNYAHGNPVILVDPSGLDPSPSGCLGDVPSCNPVVRLSSKAWYLSLSSRTIAILGLIGISFVEGPEQGMPPSQAGEGPSAPPGGPSRGREALRTLQVLTRKTLGTDMAVSRHIIERLDGKAVSVTHQVVVRGEVVHQHQRYIGKYGTWRYFASEWTEYPYIRFDPWRP